MKKRRLLFCLGFLCFLLVWVTGCGYRVPRSHVVSTKQIPVSNGRIAVANQIQKSPMSTTQSALVFSEVQLISPTGTGALTLPTPEYPRTEVLADSSKLPIWAPNGKRLTLIAGQELFITNADGTGSSKIGEYRELIPNPEDFAWSPDSQRLAYGIYGNIIIAQADGSRKTWAVDSHLRRADSILLGWSADSRSILFVQPSDRDHLALYRLSIPEILPDDNQPGFQNNRQHLATWSSDEYGGCRMHTNGRQVACFIAQAVKLIDIEDGHQSDFLTSQLTSLPVWSPDGRMIAFTTGDTPQTLWTIMAGQGLQLPRRIAEDISFITWQWSPDAQRLLFVPYPRFVDGFKIGQGLFIIDPDGKNKKTVVAPGQKGIEITSVSWQPVPVYPP
jgi:Tol biopolymer transport system component